MMRDLAQQLGSFELSFQDILLAAFANPITSIRDFLDLFKKLTVAVENLQGLLDVGDLKVSVLHLLKNGAPDGFELLPADRSILLGGFALELQLSRIGQVLRNSKSNVGEITVAESCKRSRAANRNVLNRDLWIRRSGNLRRNLSRRLPAPASRENIGIVARGFVQQGGEGSRQIGRGQSEREKEHDQTGFEGFHRSSCSPEAERLRPVA